MSFIVLFDLMDSARIAQLVMNQKREIDRHGPIDFHVMTYLENYGLSLQSKSSVVRFESLRVTAVSNLCACEELNGCMLSSLAKE